MKNQKIVWVSKCWNSNFYRENDTIEFEKQSLNEFVINIFEQEKNNEIKKGLCFMDFIQFKELLKCYLINDTAYNLAIEILKEYLFIKNHRIVPTHYIMYEINKLNFYRQNFDMNPKSILFNPDMLTRKILIEKHIKLDLFEDFI